MNKDIFYPDYNNSILGIPNSILSYYGAKPHHKTLPALDKVLTKNFKNIVLYVLDGLGVEALNTHAPNGFLKKNCITELSSVYPCTTTSALTTLETGLTPIEHGWLGWSSYFKEVDECVDLFTGEISGTERTPSIQNITWEVIGYKNLFKQINDIDPSVENCRVSPFGEYKTDTNEEICGHIQALCKKDGRRYIYAYHYQPDGDMHRTGCNSERVKADIVLFDKQIEQLAGNLNDTLLIIIADHGLTDVKFSMIEDFPEIRECLEHQLSREPRCLSFFIKPEYADVFPDRWNREFGNDFMLMTGDDAIKKGLFGSGIQHIRSKDFIGDYVALGTGNRALWFRYEKGGFEGYKAVHAGLRREEMIVPLIIAER